MKSHPPKLEVLPPSPEQKLREYWSAMVPQVRERGHAYYVGGRVTAISRLSGMENNFLIEVRGSHVYQVDLGTDEYGWDAGCTCPVGFDCKHICAAVEAVLDHPEWLGGTVTAEPPQSSLEQTLAERHGRKLKREERQQIQQLLHVHAQYQRSGYFSVYELMRGDNRYANPHMPHDFVHPPKDAGVVDFWNCLAYQFRKTRYPMPDFMLPLEDPARAEQLLATERRRLVIQAWQQAIAHSAGEHTSPEQAAASGFDFRLRWTKEGMTHEVKMPGQAEFKLLKPTPLKSIMQDYENGRVWPVPEATGVFLAARQRWAYGRHFQAEAGTVSFAQTLRFLALTPAGRERMVNGAGQPFAWAEAPLRWKLTEAAHPEGDHVLELTTPDGATVKDLWTVLPSKPPLYITSTTMYPGPMPLGPVKVRHDHHHYYDGADELKVAPAARIEIPGPAVDSAAGAQFLNQLGVGLPRQLESRIEKVPLKLTVKAQHDRSFGMGHDCVFFDIRARDNRDRTWLAWGQGGWYQAHDAAAAKAAKSQRIPVLDRSRLADPATVLLPLDLKWNTYVERWYLRVTRKFPERLNDWLTNLPPDVDVVLDKELAPFRAPAVAASVRLDCQAVEGIDWFDLRVVVNVTDTELTKEEIKVLLDAHGQFVHLDGKGWRRMTLDIPPEDDAKLARLGLRADDLSSEPQRLHALQLADPAAEKFLSEQQWAAVRERASQITTEVAPPVPAGIRAELRHYQVAGYHFLAYLAENAFGGILADDMGLGKTLQALTWLTWLRARAEAAGPSLVVCPKSVMDTWQAESAHFAPDLKVTVWRGTEAEAFRAEATAADLIVINYAQLRALAPAIHAQPWLAVILDEGQCIKNPNSLTARAARDVQARHRLILTGTPIENRLLDLWSLMSFAMPGILGPRNRFAGHYDKAGDPLARQRLAARVRPFLLRRTKDQVAPELPPRTEEDLVCEMTPTQNLLYRAELKHAQQMLLGVQSQRELDKARFNFLTSLLRLRQICCHPALVKEGEKDSAKLDALQELLEPLMEEGHKVLVFSQFVTLIRLLERMMKQNEWNYFTLTGETENRGPLVASFQAHPGAAVFLISLKAGGFGLNLTAASYVVICDPWWNPAVENQAIDRTHRIGQARHVMAYRLLMKNTIEEKIRQLQKTKSALAQDVLGEEQFAQALTLDDFRFLLADEPEPAGPT